jgi:glycosyltransferase involved in cell wall biosynthesis
MRERTDTPFEIHIVGDGPDKAHFLDQIAERSVQQYFKLHGYVEHTRLPEHYLNADIFVLPSLAEGMPNVVLEAMGSGLPIVATDVPGSEELVRNGENGYLLKTREPDDLAHALLALITNPQQRKLMGYASQHLAGHYTWKKVTQRYQALYAEMLRNERNSIREDL